MERKKRIRNVEALSVSFSSCWKKGRYQRRISMPRCIEGLAKTLHLQALLDIHQSKLMRVNMKDPVELEPSKKIDEMRRLIKKELRLIKKPMGTLLKSSESCGLIRKKSYMSVNVGMAYSSFINEDIRDSYFDYEQAVLLRFCLLKISKIRIIDSPQVKLGLILEEKVTAPSIPQSENRVQFGLGFSDELLRTRLMLVWELMKPSWCLSPNADMILRGTQDVQIELNADCNLRYLNIIKNVMTTASRSKRENSVELNGWGTEEWVKLVSCVAKV